MSKEYIEQEDAKARLRMWITDCVLDGDNEAADCRYGIITTNGKSLDFQGVLAFAVMDSIPFPS